MNSKEKPKLYQPRRIQFLDLFRSCLVFGMIILHSGYYDWEGVDDHTSSEVEEMPSLVMQILIFLIGCGGVFSLISGILFSYTTYNRVTSKTNSPRQIFLATLIRSICLVFYHFLFMLGLCTEGIIYQFICPDLKVDIDYELMKANAIHNDSTYGFAVNSVFLCLLLLLFVKLCGGWSKGVLVILFTLTGIIIMAITQYVRVLLMYATIDSSYGIRWLVNPLFFRNFPTFPILAYMSFGAAFGIALTSSSSSSSPSSKKTDKKLLKTFFRVVLVLSSVFGSYGFVGVYTRFGGIQGKLVPEISERGIEFKKYSNALHLALIFIILVLGIRLFDSHKFAEEEDDDDEEMKTGKQGQGRESQGAFARLQRLKTTIYGFEGVSKGLSYFVFNVLYSKWRRDLPVVLAFGLFHALLWIFLEVVWGRVGYILSVEQVIAYFVEKCSGKKSFAQK